MYKDSIVKFNNEDVRFKINNENGEASVFLQDIVKYCGWTQTRMKKDKKYTTIMWERIKGYLEDIGLLHLCSKTPKELKSMYIEEKYMYMLIAKANNDKSKEFMKWVGKVISNIRKNGYYISTEEEREKWFGIREDSKFNRKNETDVIKIFVEYAIKQGSQSANRYYTIYSNLANKFAGIPSKSRDKASQKQLVDVITAENIIKKIILKEMAKETDYKTIYKICKEKIEDMII